MRFVRYVKFVRFVRYVSFVRCVRWMLTGDDVGKTVLSSVVCPLGRLMTGLGLHPQ